MTKTNNNELPTLEEIANVYAGNRTLGAVCNAAEIAVTLLPQLHTLVVELERQSISSRGAGAIAFAEGSERVLRLLRSILAAYPPTPGKDESR